MNRKTQTVFFATGAAIALASSALIADFAIRKCMKKTVYAAGLCVGIAGIAAGAAVAAYPKIKSVRQRKTEELVSEDDIDQMSKCISDVFDEDEEKPALPAADAEDGD